MKLKLAVGLVTLAVSAVAFAQSPETTQPPPTEPSKTDMSKMMDMSKVGPTSRKPTNEAKTKQEIQKFFKEEEALMKARDFEKMLTRIDFPVFMATDDATGKTSAQSWDRQQYTDMMKPMFEQMPADMKMTHKPTVTVLSDSLAVVTDDFTTTMKGKKHTGRTAALLVKQDGQWKWKSFVEAGWGNSMPATGGSAAPEDQQPPPQSR